MQIRGNLATMTRRRVHYSVRFLLFITAGTAVVAAIAGSYLNRRSANRINAAHAQLSCFEQQIFLYDLDVGEFPTTRQGLRALLSPPSDLPDPGKWRGPYAAYELPVDPWSHRYNYERLDSNRCRVYSSGPDGIANTGDDIDIISSRSEGMPHAPD